MQNADAINSIVISNWNQSRITFSNFPVYDGFNHQWPIEVFKQYQVSLSVSNALGSSKATPLVALGWSAEAPPTVAPYQLHATNVEASRAELAWKWPSPSAGDINGFFTSLRIEWCHDENGQLCDRYKITQNVKLAKPSKELYPNLRINQDHPNSWIYEDEHLLRNYNDHQNLQYSPTSYREHKSAVLQNLPGLSRIRVWLRVLNIQYEGPNSEILLLQTKEGVPEAVSEFTHSFASVDSVDVVWARPFQSNGILTGYRIDVIADGDKEDCDTFKDDCDFILYHINIDDPDQMATRISGLKINSSYKLLIYALTAVGSGKSRELEVNTAKQQHIEHPVEFSVSPVYGSNTAINVSLVDSQETSATLNDRNHRARLQRDDSLQEKMEGSGYDEGIRAFLVQFKRLQHEQWEETEKVFGKNWQIIGNLAPGEKYHLRVILALSPSLSYVSPIRTLRVPRPGESGFGLSVGASNVIYDLHQTLSEGGDAALVFKIFVPLAVILFLLVFILSTAFCLRGPFKQKPSVRRRRAPKKKQFSIQVPQQLNGCRMGDRNRTTFKSILDDSKKSSIFDASNDASDKCIEKETIVYVPIRTTIDATHCHENPTQVSTSRPFFSRQHSRGENALSLISNELSDSLFHCKSFEQSRPQPSAMSTFYPNRCVSPSFALIAPMTTSPAPDSSLRLPSD